MRRKTAQHIENGAAGYVICADNGPSAHAGSSRLRHDHFVQFYDDEEILLDSVPTFLNLGWEANEGSAVFATPEHLNAIANRLSELGADLEYMRSRGHLIEVDAAQTLSQIMVNGLPDSELFHKFVGEIIKKTAQDRSGLRAYGEMVALLWADGQGAAALRLEKLWNNLLKEHSFRLFCAYPLGGFGNEQDGETFRHICDAHSRVLPTESYFSQNEADRLREVASLQQQAFALQKKVNERQRSEKAHELSSLMPAENPAPVLRVNRENILHFANPKAQEFLSEWHTQVGDPAPLPIVELIGNASRHDAEMSIAERCYTVAVVPAPNRAFVNLYFSDITDRKRAEEALRLGEERLRLFIENAPAAIAMFDREMRYLAVSRRWIEDYHLDDNLLGRSHYEVFPDLPAHWQEIHRRGLSGEIQHSNGERFERADGSVQWVKWDLLPWRSATNEIGGIILAAEEITARKLAEENLRASEERYRATFDNAAVGIAHVGLDGRWLYFNKTICSITGYSCEELQRMTFAQITHPDDIEADRIQARQLMAGETSHYTIEKRYLRKEGSDVWVGLTVSLLRDPAGNPLNFICIVENIDERKRSREALRESEQRNLQLLSLMPSAAYTCDDQGRITFYNRRAAELWGREPALGDHDQKFCGAFKLRLPGGSPLPHAFTPMARAVREGIPCRDCEVVIERPDASCVTVNVNIDPIFDKNGRQCGAINVFQDVTARKLTEKALRASEERLASDLRAMTLLYEVGNQCADGSTGFEQCLYHILDAAIFVTGADRGNLQLLDRKTGSLVIASHRGFQKAFLDFFSEVHRHDSAACGTAMRSCERVVVEDISRSEIFAGTSALDIMLAAGAHAVQSTPLISSAGNLLGMISTHFGRAHRPADRELRLVDLLSRQAADYLERKHAEEAFRDQQAQLEAELADSQLLQEISAALVREDNEGAIHEKVMDAAAAIMHSDMACLQVMEKEEDALRLLTWRGFDHTFGDLLMWCRQDSLTCCSQARKCGQRIIVPDVEKWEYIVNTPTLDEFRKLGVAAVQSTPLVSRSGQLVGMITTHWRRPHTPSIRSLQLLDILARQAADLLERRQAEEELRKRSQRQELLSATLGQLLSARDPDTIVRELFPKVAAHLSVDTYFNFMVNPAGDALTLHSCAGISDETARGIQRLEFGQAICGTVAQTRQSIHAMDVQHSNYEKAALVRGFGIQCYACNPLMVGDRLLGTLSFASRTRTSFDADELQFLRIISQYAAVALDRLRQSEQLREGEERFRAVLDNSTAVIYVKDCEGRYLLINTRYEQLFHLTKEQMLGKIDQDIFPPDAAAKFRENDLTVLRTGQPLEIEEIAPHDDGPHTYISIKFPLRRADRTIYAVAGISTDITDRKRAQESMARLAAIVEHSDDAIFSIDLEARIRSWNQGAERLFGYTENEALAQPITLLVPENRDNEEPDILNRIRAGQAIENYETLRRRKDGTHLNISLTVSPIKDSSGNVIGASKVARDITHKVRNHEILERTVAERTASLREALEQMEEFSYSVSHDLRGPLRSMNAYAGILLEDYGHQLDETARGYLDKIQRSSDRMNRLTQDVLAYSRVARAQAQPETVELDRLVQDVIHQHTTLQPPEAEIEIVGPLSSVQGHESTLGQSVSNLLNNAVKFVAPGVKPRVRVRAENHGKFVRLWFEDNGIGIKPEHQQRIFQMFERLHPDGTYDGTGIGLTIVRKAIEKMGGRVGLESDGQTGTSFWIELPSAL